MPNQALGFRVQGYGMRRWTDLFTNRQLTALTTFSDLVDGVRNHARSDGAEEGYADAVATYMAITVSRMTDYVSTIATLGQQPSNGNPQKHLCPYKQFPCSSDFAESTCSRPSSGTPDIMISAISKAIDATAQLTQFREGEDNLLPRGRVPEILYPQIHLTTNNVAYADLSDYFYVWLRQSLRSIYPSLLGTMLTPKADELVTDPFRHGGKRQAERFFEDGFTDVFGTIFDNTPSGYPITVFYAFKQAETDNDGTHASTGWETLLEGMLAGGWAITATWPIATERGGRMRDVGSNALASSVVLACRPRPTDAGFTDRLGLIKALREEFPDALRLLEQGKVAPVDLRQAAIGPGMAVFSRYARVNEPDGTNNARSSRALAYQPSA